MAVPFLLIDGYNLLHAAGFARSHYAQGMLERSRIRLISYLLNHLSAVERQRATVVFDAGDAPVDLPRKMNVQGLQVVYAKPGGDADSEIERMILSHSAPRLLRIISSDHRLQKAARKRRCRFSDSEVFVEELEERGPLNHPVDNNPQSTNLSNPKYSGHLLPEDLDYWLQVFGESADMASEGFTETEEETSTLSKQGSQEREDSVESAHSAHREDEEKTEQQIGRSELDFWQKRVDDLLDELDEDDFSP